MTCLAYKWGDFLFEKISLNSSDVVGVGEVHGVPHAEGLAQFGWSSKISGIDDCVERERKYMLIIKY